MEVLVFQGPFVYNLGRRGAGRGIIIFLLSDSAEKKEKQDTVSKLTHAPPLTFVVGANNYSLAFGEVWKR